MRSARALRVVGGGLLVASGLAGACGVHRTPDRAAAPASDAGRQARTCGHSRLPRAPICGSSSARVLESGLDASTPELDAQLSLDPKTAQRVRGEYLVRHVAACMECHTPRLPTGAFDETKLLSGVEQLADLEPDDDTLGAVHSRNLTPDKKTGLGTWSDDQIKKAFQEGVDDEGKLLSWMMPYWIFHNMKAEDADAVVAFLRSVPAVEHEVPENQPLSIALERAYELPEAAIPKTTLEASDPDYASAERGRYLATSVAPCVLCHTPVAPGDLRVPIDASRLLTGRRKLIPVRLGVQVPANPPLIESFNLTPHANGIGAFSPQDVANTLRQGVGKSGLPVCDPMPSSFGGSFLGMTAADALDIGHYLTTIPAVDSGVVSVCCTACHKGSSADGGGP